MAEKLFRGAVIVIEGADRVGKSTRAVKLVQALSQSGEKIQLLKFPDRETAIGGLISQYLQRQKNLDDHVIHLLFSANRWEWFSRMKEALETGTSLVIDRYAYSGVAYSSSKQDIDFEWCKQSDKGLIKADAVLYISLPHDVASQRPGFGDEVYEQSDFQTRVRQNYDRLRDETWIDVCGNVPEEQLDSQLFQIAGRTIAKVRAEPISYLW